MGLFGRISSLFRGSPKAPPATPYTPEAYFGYDPNLKRYMGPGAGRTLGVDKMAYQALQDMSDRPYGFTEEELRAIYEPTAENINLNTASMIRRVNRDAAAGGAYGSGGRRRAVGEASTQGMRAAAQHMWNTRALQARTALEDRYRRLAALEGYALPRLGLMGGEHARRLGYQQGTDAHRLAAYQSALNQYNRDFDWTWNLGMQAGSAATGGGGLSGFFGGGG